MKPILPVLLLLLLLANCSMRPPSTASQQIIAWAGAGNNRFQLSQIMGLPSWTVLHVFAPYTAPASMQQQMGFEWKESGRYKLENRNDICLAVFVAGTNVVHVEEWRRAVLDCGPDVSGRALRPNSVIQIDRTKTVPRLTLSE